MIKRPTINLELIQRVLGDDYLDLQIVHLHVDEDYEENGVDGGAPEVAEDGSCRVEVVTVDTHGRHETVEGKGCGVVDALFDGLLGRFAIEYPSLKSIELDDFVVKAMMNTKSGQAGVDARGEVTVVVRNSEGTRFAFSDDSRSIVSSTARAVLAAVEYFVNAERAFITLYKSRKDAQKRHRPDLVTRYTREMAEVVKSTSYGEVIENIKKELT